MGRIYLKINMNMALDWSSTSEIPTDTNENLKANSQTICLQPINE